MEKLVVQEVDKTSPLIENLVWLNSEEAAIYLRKFRKDGTPSVEAIRTAVYRGQIKARKWNRHLYFRRTELDWMIENSLKKGGL